MTSKKTSVDGKQHYVPKFLLNQFSFSTNNKERKKSRSIAVYDKSQNRLWIANTKDVCAHRDFYNLSITKKLLKELCPGKNNPIDNLYQEFPENIGQLSIEENMSFYEDRIPEIFKKIITAESSNCLSDEEWCKLVIFIVHLDIRNPSIRKLMENISIQIKSAVTNAQKENAHLKLSNEPESITDQERLKYSHLKNTMNISERFPKELLSMHTFLFKAPSGHKFFISDRPILRLNYYGDFNGYETPGIEILVPISDKFYIIFFHKGFIQTLVEVNNTKHSIKQRLLDFIDNDYSNNQKSRIILDSREGNKPIVSLAALQIINSAQYLNANHTFCSSQEYLEESITLFEKYFNISKKTVK